MTVATVLIPTHNHGPMVRHAIASALGQTQPDLEVFVVGDGAPSVTADIVSELARADDRVRWFGNEKGPRHGEVHRHAALQEASGEIVLYLSDDELYLPDHVATMHRALTSADVATAVIIKPPDEGMRLRIVDLSRRWVQERLRAGLSGSPLSGIGHTLEAYRALPEGWRTTPAGIATDVYMLQQFLEAGASFAMADRPTVLGLRSPEGQGISLEEAEARMAEWAAQVRDDDGRERLLASVTTWLIAQEVNAAAKDAKAAARELADRPKLAALRADLAAAQARVAELEAVIAQSGGAPFATGDSAAGVTPG